MLFKIIGWLLAVSVVFWLLGVLLGLLPFIFIALLSVVALLCIYSLLPTKFRIKVFEQWLGIEKKPRNRSDTTPVVGSSTDNLNSTTDTTNNSDDAATPETEPVLSSPTFEPEPEPEPELIQPELKFDTIKFNPGGKLPDREELKANLKRKVIGQDAAIDILVRVVLGKLASKNNKPLVIFLPGPSGTGKTELSKALAEALKSKLTRFDMGEFKESHKASNLFGSPKGYVGSTDGGELPNALRTSKKRCILLFDEADEAHQSLWRQMLAFFDEGRVSDVLGQTLAPKNTICILTSNLDADKIAKNPEAAKEIIKLNGYFPPQFIGRIDKVIPMLRLGASDTAKLTVIQAKKLANEFDVNLIIEQKVLGELVNATSDAGKEYGGRGIMEKIGDLIGDDLLDLQGQQIFQARLIVKNDRLRAVPLI